MAASKAAYSDGSVLKGVVQWCQQKPKEFFAAGIHQLQHHCDKCLNTCTEFANGCNNSNFSTLKWLSVVYGVTSKNTIIFKATIMKTSNLTQHDK